MNLTDQAAKVLAEIDAALAICEKATTGYVYRPDEPSTVYIGNDVQQQSIFLDSRKPVSDGTFIAASRTVCPKSLRCLKTAIEGLLQTRKSAAAIKKIHWGDDGDCGADGRACDIYDFSTDALTTLINQWNSK